MCDSNHHIAKRQTYALQNTRQTYGSCVQAEFENFINIFRVKIGQKSQVTIPSKVREALNLGEGNSLFGIYDSNSGEIRCMRGESVDPAKVWLLQDR